MKEDPRLTPRPWWSYGPLERREHTSLRRGWAGGFAFLAVVVVAVRTLVFALSRL